MASFFRFFFFFLKKTEASNASLIKNNKEEKRETERERERERESSRILQEHRNIMCLLIAMSVVSHIVRQSSSDLHKFSDDTQLFSFALPADFGTLIKQRRVSNMSRLGWSVTNLNSTVTKLRHWLSILAHCNKCLLQ